MADFVLIMQTMFPWEWDRKNYNSTDGVYRFSNGSIFCVDGTDDIHKLRGLRQHIAHLNEAVPEIGYMAWQEINKRTEWFRFIDFNPSMTKHWVFESILTRPEDHFHYEHSTFRDNPFCPETAKAEIMGYEPTPENIKAGTADWWQWQVYGLGLRARMPGSIFTNWGITNFWPERRACERWWLGLDFGFVNPTALIEGCLFQDQLYLRQLVYETGLVTAKPLDPTIPSLVQRLEELEIRKQDKIWCDQAHATQIAELKAAGYGAVGAPKSRGENGDLHTIASIKRFRQYYINIHIASQDLQTEIENWRLESDPHTGELTDTPVDEFNHGLKAAMYGGFHVLPLSPSQIAEKYKNVVQNRSNRRNISPLRSVSNRHDRSTRQQVLFNLTGGR